MVKQFLSTLVGKKLTRRNVVPALPLGVVVITPHAQEVLEACSLDVDCLLDRHKKSDWGDVCGDTAQLNRLIVEDGRFGRVMSSYAVGPDGKIRIWVITESDFSVTTVLLPSDY